MACCRYCLSYSNCLRGSNKSLDYIELVMHVGNIFPIISLAIIITILAVFLKENQLPSGAMLLALAGGALIFLRLLPPLRELLALLESLASKTSLNNYYLVVVMKIIAVAYVAEFGAQVCRDAGQGAMALKVEFAAKISIMLLAVPVMAAILESVIRLLS